MPKRLARGCMTGTYPAVGWVFCLFVAVGAPLHAYAEAPTVPLRQSAQSEPDPTTLRSVPGPNGKYADDGLPNPYLVGDAAWAQMPPGFEWGAIVSAAIDRKGNLYLLHRCHDDSCEGRPEAPLVILDRSGKFIRSFGAGLFIKPHGLWIDGHGDIWAGDYQASRDKGFQFLNFSPGGKLLKTMGRRGYSQATADQFFVQPTKLITNAQGEIFTAEGHNAIEALPGGRAYVNTPSPQRLAKFSKNGKLLRTWGGPGAGPGQLNVPHDLAFDSRGRLFVADRGNSRIQIFDQDGNFIAAWKQFGRPSAIFISADDTMYVSDVDSNERLNPGFRKGIWVGSAKDGSRRAFIPQSHQTGLVGPEALAVDREGNIYAGTIAHELIRYGVR
jgi:hypothetical protein